MSSGNFFDKVFNETTTGDIYFDEHDNDKF